MKPTIAILLLLVLMGCGSGSRLFTGATDPKIEDKETLTSYMTKIGMLQHNICTVTFDDYRPTMARIHGALPGVLVFNQKGQCLDHGGPKALQAKSFDFIQKLDRKGSYATSDSLSLDDCLLGLRDFKGNMVELISTEKTDFFVFLYWAKWSGNANKKQVMAWEKQAMWNKNARIKVIKVNMDWQDYWGLENVLKLKG